MIAMGQHVSDVGSLRGTVMKYRQTSLPLD